MNTGNLTCYTSVRDVGVFFPGCKTRIVGASARQRSVKLLFRGVVWLLRPESTDAGHPELQFVNASKKQYASMIKALFWMSVSIGAGIILANVLS